MLEVEEVLNPDRLPAKPMKFPEKLMFKIVLKAFFKNKSRVGMSLVVEHYLVCIRPWVQSPASKTQNKIK